MAWPPIIPPNTFLNDDPQQDAHPDLHNLTADALAELVAQVGPMLTILSSVQYAEVVPTANGAASTGTNPPTFSGAITFPAATFPRLMIVTLRTLLSGTGPLDVFLTSTIAGGNVARYRTDHDGSGSKTVMLTHLELDPPGGSATTFSWALRATAGTVTTATSGATVNDNRLQGVAVGYLP